METLSRFKMSLLKVGDMHPWHDVPLGPHFPKIVPAIVEVPARSNVKYAMDAKTGLLKLKQVLLSAAYFPMNFGFIPQTIGNDGDPVDIFVISQAEIFPLTIVDTRILGGFIINSKEKKNEYRLIGASIHDPMCDEYRSLKEVPLYLRKEIKQLFEIYKTLEGENVVIGKTFSQPEAFSIIKKCHANYDKLHLPRS